MRNPPLPRHTHNGHFEKSLFKAMALFPSVIDESCASLPQGPFWGAPWPRRTPPSLALRGLRGRERAHAPQVGPSTGLELTTSWSLGATLLYTVCARDGLRGGWRQCSYFFKEVSRQSCTRGTCYFAPFAPLWGYGHGWLTFLSEMPSQSAGC